MTDTTVATETGAVIPARPMPNPGVDWATAANNAALAVHSLIHYLAVAGFVAGVMYATKQGMVDKDMVDLAFAGAATVVGIKNWK